MLGNSAQRPSAEECLCYQWLQPGRTTLCNVVPMPVLFGLKVWTCELFLIHDIWYWCWHLKMQVLHWCFGMFWISSMNGSWFGGCSTYVLMESVLQALFLLAQQGHTSLSIGSVFEKTYFGQSCKFQKTSGFSTLSAFLLLRLERLLHYDARIRGSKACCHVPCHGWYDTPTTNHDAQEVAGNVMTQLSSGRISCASSVFAKATLPRQFEAGQNRGSLHIWHRCVFIFIFYIL